MNAAADLSITPYEGAAMATRLSPEVMDEAVQALLPEQVPVYLRRLDEATSLINALRKLLVGRMLVERRLDEHVTVDGRVYVFEQGGSAKFGQIPELFADLIHAGLALADVAAAVTDLRVTDLREAIALLPEEDGYPRRTETVELLESYRVWKKSAPRLVAEDDPYRRKR